MYARRTTHTPQEAYIRRDSIDGTVTAISKWSKPRELLILEIMSGAGLFGSAVSEELNKKGFKVKIDFLNLSGKQLKDVESKFKRKVFEMDVRDVDRLTDEYAVIIERYGLKDLRKEDQPKTIKKIASKLKRNGLLVLVDMTCDKENKKIINDSHALKQKLGGQKEKLDDKCNIPAIQEWRKLLKNAGLRIVFETRFNVGVSMRAWFESGQIDEIGLTKMRKFFKSKPAKEKKSISMREHEEDIKMTLPIIVLAGERVLAGNSETITTTSTESR